MSRPSKTPDTANTSLEHAGSSRPSKEEKRLSRAELLELLVQLSSENDSLREENTRLREQLEDRSIALSEAGSIAEASLRLSGIFEAAQKAADDYLGNVKRLADAGGPAVPNPASEAAAPPSQAASGARGRHMRGVR